MSAETPTSEEEPTAEPVKKKRKSPATQFFLKGLAISLPPVLTLAILIWIGRGINDYIISPVNTLVRRGVAEFIENTRPTDDLVQWERLPPLRYWNQIYDITPQFKSDLEDRLKTEDGQALLPNATIPVAWIMERPDQVYIPFGEKSVPYVDYEEVAVRVHPSEMPISAIGVYMELAPRRSRSVVPFSVIVLVMVVLLLYFLGRIVTARVGAWVFNKVETTVLGRLPIISNVYSSVKQVTDFFFTERSVEYNRVVAVEYPRRGLWSIGFVTSNSFLEITAAAGEPLVSVLMPTSPMPMTGFTVSVPRSEVLDLNITIDQAFQYCLSCGVLVPPQQMVTPELLQKELAKRLTGSSLNDGRRDVEPSSRTPGGMSPPNQTEQPEAEEPT